MKKIIVLVSSLLLITLSVRVTPALAASITVNTTAPSPGGSGDCTLGEAIVAANTDTAVDACAAGSGTDTITLPVGTYTLTNFDHTDARQGNTGFPTISSSLTINGAGSADTIVERANGAPDFRLFQIASGQVTFTSFTIRGGNTSYSPQGPTLGGAVSNLNGTLILDAMLITANAMGAVHGAANVQVIDSQINDNGGIGVVMYNEPDPSGNLTITNSELKGNLGGINVTRASAQITNSTLANNTADAVFSDLSNVTITQSTLANNGASGVNTRRLSSVTLIQSAVFGNKARGLAFNNSIGNVINTTIAQNQGGIIKTGNNGTVYIINSTITANSGGRGAGIYNAKGIVQIVNTILSGNYGGPGADCYGPLKSKGHNLFGKIANCQVDIHKGDRVTDPLLAAWSNDNMPGNGHYPLLSSSPAINKGSIVNCPTTDQLENLRVGRCDIGAIEFIPPP